MGDSEIRRLVAREIRMNVTGAKGTDGMHSVKFLLAIYHCKQC